MRKITRTLTVVVLATTLTATTALAAPSTPRPRRERASIVELAQRLMKRIFGGITANSEMSVPKPAPDSDTVTFGPGGEQ